MGDSPFWTGGGAAVVVVVAETGGFCEEVTVVVVFDDVVVAGLVEVCDCTGGLAVTVVVTFVAVDVDEVVDAKVSDDVDVVDSDDAVDDTVVVEVFAVVDAEAVSDEASAEDVVTEVTTGLLSAALSVVVLPQEAVEQMSAAVQDNTAAVLIILYFSLRIKSVSILCLLFMIDFCLFIHSYFITSDS